MKSGRCSSSQLVFDKVLSGSTILVSCGSPNCAALILNIIPSPLERSDFRFCPLMTIKGVFDLHIKRNSNVKHGKGFCSPIPGFFYDQPQIFNLFPSLGVKMSLCGAHF